jgi:hypothetical protein
VIDELSVLIAPVADGGVGTPSLFDARQSSGPVRHLKLLSVERRPGDLLWVRCRCEAGREVPKPRDRMEGTPMKLLAATVASLSLLASGSDHSSQASGASGGGAAPTASVQAPPPITITRGGSQPSRKGPAENFTGSVRIDPLFQTSAPSRTTGAYVTFEPGARTAWHPIHSARS